MKQTTNFILYVLTFSVLGVLLGLPFIFIFGRDIFLHLFLNFGLGLLIGLISRGTFVLFYKNIIKDTLMSFLMLILGIGLSAFLGVFCIMGIQNILYVLIIILTVELLSIFICIFIHRYALKLNVKLKEVKKHRLFL